MPGRGRSSFTKRQKERSRQDKQREKTEKKAQRKQEGPGAPEDETASIDFAAVQEQWALPGETVGEVVDEE